MPSLLTARDAAKLLGVSERTAQRRAQAAARQGDPGVTRYGNYWAATAEWWREQLRPKRPGRPPKHSAAEYVAAAPDEQQRAHPCKRGQPLASAHRPGAGNWQRNMAVTRTHFMVEWLRGTAVHPLGVLSMLRIGAVDRVTREISPAQSGSLEEYHYLTLVTMRLQVRRLYARALR